MGLGGISCVRPSLGIEYIIQSALEKQPEYKSGQLYLFGALFLTTTHTLSDETSGRTSSLFGLTHNA